MARLCDRCLNAPATREVECYVGNVNCPNSPHGQCVDCAIHTEGEREAEEAYNLAHGLLRGQPGEVHP